MTTSSSGAETPTAAGNDLDLPRKIGFWGAIAVLVGVVIGSGIAPQRLQRRNNED